MTRLPTVLRLRQLVERRALAAQARAEAARRDAEHVLDDARSAYAERPPVSGLLHADGLVAMRLQGLAAHDRVLAAAAGLDAAAASAEQAARDTAAAGVRRASVERLVDRQRQEQAETARRAADRALDELVVLRWRQR